MSAADAIKNADELYSKASKAYKMESEEEEDSDFEPAPQNLTDEQKVKAALKAEEDRQRKELKAMNEWKAKQAANVNQA